MEETMKVAVVDIGGTNIKAGIWEDDAITGIREVATQAEFGGGHVIGRVKELLRDFAPVDAIGISTAGQVDTKRGRILYANENIPGYTGTPVKEILEAEFAVPAAVLNDVNAAALGEAYYGAGADSRDFLCLTYGTGVGGAIVMDGKIYTGASFSAGEFGAIVVHPEERDVKRDVFSGCYERYASVTALVQGVREAFPKLTDGRRIFEQMEQPNVRQLIDAWIDEVVYGLVSLTHIFNPSLIVLGGGVMEQPYVIGQVQERLKSQVMESFSQAAVVQAKLGNRAGMFGASQAALEEYHVRHKGKRV